MFETFKPGLSSTGSASRARVTSSMASVIIARQGGDLVGQKARILLMVALASGLSDLALKSLFEAS